MFQSYPQIPSKSWLGPIIFTVGFHIAVPLFLHTGHLLFESRTMLPEVYTVTLFNAEEAPLPSPAVIEKPAPEIKTAKPIVTSTAPEAVSLRPRKYTATKKKKKKVDQAFRKKEISSALDRIRTKQAAEHARRDKEKAVSKALAAIQNRLRSSTGTTSGYGKNATPGGMVGKGPSVDLDNVTRQYYSAVSIQIQENWILPEFQTWKKDLQAVLVVKVLRNGEVNDMHFEKKSSNSYFNQFVLKAVREASPLPPFPKNISAASMEFGLVFHPAGLM